MLNRNGTGFSFVISMMGEAVLHDRVNLCGCHGDTTGGKVVRGGGGHAD